MKKVTYHILNRKGKITRLVEFTEMDEIAIQIRARLMNWTLVSIEAA